MNDCGHVREVCPKCSRVVKQCRCMGPKTEKVADQPCSDCSKSPSPQTNPPDKHEAQRNFPTNIWQGQRWKHYKGGEYEVVSLGVKEDTAEKMVVYRSLAYGTVWIRTLTNWFENVTTPDGRLVPRFKTVEE